MHAGARRNVEDRDSLLGAARRPDPTPLPPQTGPHESPISRRHSSASTWRAILASSADLTAPPYPPSRTSAWVPSPGHTSGSTPMISCAGLSGADPWCLDQERSGCGAAGSARRPVHGVRTRAWERWITPAHRINAAHCVRCPRRALEAVASATTHFVTLTVSEKGYEVEPQDLTDPAHPALRSRGDRARPGPPTAEQPPGTGDHVAGQRPEQRKNASTLRHRSGRMPR